MTEDRLEPAAGATRSGRSRRRFLAALGAGAASAGLATTAGCLSFADEGSESASFHVSELPEVDDDPTPVTWATYPVGIPREYRRDAQSRTNDLLERVPTPLSARAIPNGHVRQHVVEAAAAARDHLDDAVTAPTERGTLDSLRRARRNARFAAAGWAAIDDGLTVESLTDEAEDVRERARRARASLEYAGVDPAPAVVVHASREALLDAATAVSRDYSHDDNARVLQVAEYAERVAGASAALADATTVADRFRRSLPGDADSLESRIEDARRALAAELRAEIEALPNERDAVTLADADIDQTVAQRVLQDLHWRAADEDPASSRDGRASGIVQGIRQFAAIEGYRRVRERVESGERYGITEPADVVDPFASVHEALERVPRRSEAPGLARGALQNAATSVQYSDERLAELDGKVHDHDVDDLVETYRLQDAIVRAVPDGVAAALDALGA